MFGKIIKVESNILTVVNESRTAHSEIIGYHVIFETTERKVVGEILEMDTEIVKILLVGEIILGVFSPGVVKKPNSDCIPRIVNTDELELIIGKRTSTREYLILGNSPIYTNFPVSVKINNLFATHSAIIGNTGSGKSCGVARMLQNLFLSNQEKPINSHIILFDAYGEYVRTFEELNTIPNLGFKKYTTLIQNTDEELLNLPVNFLGVDDLAILLSVTDADLIPVLEKTLKLVYVFTSTDPNVKEYKNDIIAKCLLDILRSGKTSSVIRDQIIAVLSHYNTENLNLESIIEQPGYNRTLKQCLLIDEQGKMNAILLVTEFLQKFERVTLDSIERKEGVVYSLNDLYYALEFALISEGTINSSVAYSKNNILKSRLQTIINSDYKDVFAVKEYMPKEVYVEKLFKRIDGTPAQLININLSHVDDRFAKILTKLYSKLLFTYTTKLKNRGSYSINIILEEAHRYVQNDTDIDVIGYNIFDRITKEGRKYSTLMTFITQRPSELSSTALSQCANFIVFRIYHPKDFEIVKNISTNISEESLEKLKTLNPGTAFVFGSGFKVPLLVRLDLPTPMPESTSLSVDKLWY